MVRRQPGLLGRLRFTIGGESAELGDGVVAPAGSELAVANTTDRPAHMWVTARVGLAAEFADGSTITPPGPGGSTGGRWPRLPDQRRPGRSRTVRPLLPACPARTRSRSASSTVGSRRRAVMPTSG
jgi:hypothetical protein